MTNPEIAKEYLRCFCEGDIVGLEPLLAPDLHFIETFHAFHSREEYIESLRNNPPEKCECKVLSVTENENFVAIFYKYPKPVRVIFIAQLFKFKNHKIQKVLLVFDGSGFD